MNELRPEYIEAVQGSLWNDWFIASLAIPPILMVLLFVFRVRRYIVVIGFISAIIASYMCFGLGVQRIWDIKEMHAQTEAEWDDVYGDTAKLFYPAIVGLPFSLIYTSSILIALQVLRFISGRIFAASDTKPRKLSTYSITI